MTINTNNGNGAHGPGNGNGNGAKTAVLLPAIIKRRFLFVSWESLSGDLAWQLTRAGHEVKVYIKNEGNAKDNDVYDGFLEKVADWRAWVDWAETVVFDDVGFGKEADALRAKGRAVVGGSMYTDRLEEDREFGQAEMKRLGMLTLPSFTFDDYGKALEFIKNHPGRYVYKPSGFVPSAWKGLLFIAKEEDGKDLYEVLEQNKSVLSKKIKQFQLQKFVSGVEVGMSAFFNGKEFITPILIAFEHKRLFPGELGSMTGEMGTSMFWAEPNRLFKETTGRMASDLAQAGYVGYIDINCIVNGRGVYPLEFTCRFGYPTISIQMEGVLSDWGEFLYEISHGNPYKLKTKRGFQVGVVCVTPPFPYDDPAEMELYKDLSILFKKPNMDGIHLGDVKMADGVWRVAGSSGYILVVTGHGTTMEEARKEAYRRLDNVILLNMFYRTDIGASWGEDSDKLQTWGYLY